MHFFYLKSRFIAPLLCLVAIAAAFAAYGTFKPAFRTADITSDEPYRSEWAVSPSNDDAILDGPWTYLDEGGQSYAFASADGRYVLKFFKFHRFRSSPFFQALPAIGPLKSWRESHATRRRTKLETAFSGYRLAYDHHREESGLLFVQLNASKESKTIHLIDADGIAMAVDLNCIPFVLQTKGSMLSETFSALLERGDLEGAKEVIDQLFALYLSEYAKGLCDLDRGIMHNIGCVDGKKLFHLDVGKLAFDESMKNDAVQQKELAMAASKVHLWLHKHYPQHLPILDQHMEKRLLEVSMQKVNKPQEGEGSNVSEN